MVVATFAMYGCLPLNNTHINAIKVDNVNANGSKSILSKYARNANIRLDAIIMLLLGRKPLFFRIFVYSFAPRITIIKHNRVSGIPPAIIANNAEMPIANP